MGEVEKVSSLLGILAGSIPGMRERIRCWGSGLAAASKFFFFFPHYSRFLEAGWGRAFSLLEEKDLIEVLTFICVEE